MTKQDIQLFLFWIVIGVAGRLMIHTPDATPTTTLCLFASTLFSRQVALSYTIITLILSDVLIHCLTSYPTFGAWTFFNYSALLLITFIGIRIFSMTNVLITTTLANVGFWIWTNFGTWCGDYGLYPHSLQGLFECYIAGLPFLRNSMIAGLVWSSSMVIIAGMKRKQHPLSSPSQ